MNNEKSKKSKNTNDKNKIAILLTNLLKVFIGFIIIGGIGLMLFYWIFKQWA